MEWCDDGPTIAAGEESSPILPQAGQPVNQQRPDLGLARFQPATLG
ncbi:hypothetical protein [Thermogemmatispora onikobensis]|nr:hypothetical protein [Thermogemmatispora onikobensis]